MGDLVKAASGSGPVAVEAHDPAPDVQVAKVVTREKFERLKEQLNLSKEGVSHKEEQLLVIQDRLSTQLSELKKKSEALIGKTSDGYHMNVGKKEDKRGFAKDLSELVDRINKASGNTDGGVGSALQLRVNKDRVFVHYKGEGSFFRISNQTTFDRILIDAAKYWDINPHDAVMTDKQGAIWQSEGTILRELQHMGNPPEAWIVRKSKERKPHIVKTEKKEKKADYIKIEEEEDAMVTLEQQLWERDQELLRSIRLTRKRKRFRVQEFMVYLAFLLTTLLIVFLRKDYYEEYQLNNAMRRLFVTKRMANGKTFETLTTYGDVWRFMDEILVPGWYFGQSNKNTLYYDTESSVIGFILNYSTPIGALRVQQIRSKGTVCNVNSELDNVRIPEALCYKDDDEIDTSPYSFGLPQFLYDETVPIPRTYGDHGVYKSDGSFALTIPNPRSTTSTQNDAVTDILQMQNGKWIDRQTRVVLIKFSVFNVNTKRITSVRLMIEFPLQGGVRPSVKIQTFRVHMFSYAQDIGVFTLQLFHACFLIYYISSTTYRLRRFRAIGGTTREWLSPWNALDACTLTLFCLNYFFELYWFLHGDRYNMDFDIPVTTFVETEHLAFWYLTIDRCTGFIIPCVSLKFLKYLTFSTNMTKLLTVVLKTLTPLLVYGTIFVFIAFAFSLMGHALFGPSTTSFKTLRVSVLNVYYIVFGGFDAEQLSAEGNVALAPMFFIIVSTVLVVILLKLFLVMVIRSYELLASQEKSEEELMTELNPDMRGVRLKPEAPVPIAG